jgi:small-conductance mechanosensitive channel
MPRLQNLDVHFVSLVDRAAVRDPSNPTEPQRFLVWKAEGGATTDPEGGTMTEAELSAALEKAETERDDAQAERDETVSKMETLTKQVEKLEKAAADAKPAEPVELNKADLSPEWQARIEKMEADQQADRERTEKAEQIAKAERDARATREFVAKAETFKHVAGDTGEFGRVLKAASEALSKEDMDLLEQRLSAANEQIDKGELFRQVGSSADGQRTSGDDAIVRKTEEIRKADPSVSQYEAMRRAAHEHGGEYLQAVR